MPPSTADRMSAATILARYDFSDTLLGKRSPRLVMKLQRESSLFAG